MPTEEQLLLQEIFAVPSNIVQKGRFDTGPIAAGCGGSCKSGTCQRQMDTDHDIDATRH